ncbi:MAG: hypothetical protein ACTSX1_15105 [Candidatus Heimdallarchaeaceae archaeon]
MEFLLYFIVGLVHDAMTAVWYLALESRRLHLAGFISGAVTFLGYGVLCYLVLSPQFIGRLISYCIGCWVGTYLAVYIKERYTPKGE